MSKTFRANGLTFTLLPGGKPSKKRLRSEIPALYSGLLGQLQSREGVDPSLVQDALHDVLVQELDRKSDRFVARPKNYLKVAAVREYRRNRKDSSRMVPFANLGLDESLKIEEEAPGRLPAAGEAAADREFAHRAWQELESLPLRQRCVLLMWCGGLSIGEIALRLDTTLENVRFHKCVALQSLRDRLGILIEEPA